MGTKKTKDQLKKEEEIRQNRPLQINDSGRFYRMKSDGSTEPCSLWEWGLMLESDRNRLVQRTEVAGITVSTVFLGIDHDFTGQGPPVLFETMAFGGEFDGWQERYCTREEALVGHENLLVQIAEHLRNKATTKKDGTKKYPVSKIRVVRFKKK